MTNNSKPTWPVVTKDGVSYYQKPDGTLIIKAVWDNLYAVGRPKGEIISQNGKGSKGDNSCKKNNWLNDKKSY